MQRALDRGHGRQQAAREDVLLDPVRAAPLRLVGDIGKADRLEAHPRARFERAIAGREERLEVLGADRLEHLDRDDRVVLAAYVAVVAQLDPSAVAQARFGDALGGELVLRSRDGDRGHVAAQLAGGVQGKAAPAAADLEHAHARLDTRPLRRGCGTCCAARPRATGRASRRRRSSRSSSRPGTTGRSRCPGRSARGCSGGCRRWCCAARGGRSSAAPAAARAASRA